VTQENTDRRRCQATRKDGERCLAWASRSTGYCPLHGPGALQIHVDGGLSKTRAHMLETRLPSRLKPVVDLLSLSIEQTHRGDLKPAQAQALASLAAALVRVVEFSELMMRVEALEAKAKLERGY
jgi:hypothetical protein